MFRVTCFPAATRSVVNGNKANSAIIRRRAMAWQIGDAESDRITDMELLHNGAALVGGLVVAIRVRDRVAAVGCVFQP